MSLDWYKRSSLLSTYYIFGVKNTIPIWVFLGSILILEKIYLKPWKNCMTHLHLTKNNIKLKVILRKGWQKVERTSVTLSLAVFSFWWVQEKRFSQGTKFIFNFSWSILVTHWLSISHNFQNGKANIACINKSNCDSHFWYELSLLQWFVPIRGTWAINAMCSFSMRSLLMQSKDWLIVIRQSPNNFLCSKFISIDSGF